ncbi:MAG: tetratricopeptide repeat protein [Candidatus Paceibacterota bacterium]|jgi:tetratricopeptide (TPR) repeat protein
MNNNQSVQDNSSTQGYPQNNRDRQPNRMSFDSPKPPRPNNDQGSGNHINLNIQHTQKPQAPIPPPTPTPTMNNVDRIEKKKGRLERIANYILLVTIILAPIVFVPTPYLALDVAKSFVIIIGILASAICYGFIVFKEKSINLPPKSISWISILLVLSLMISSFLSIHVAKSFFGQGFEIGTVGFVVLLFVAGLVSFEAVRREPKRVSLIYRSLLIVFCIVFLFQGLRLIFGPTFLTMSVFLDSTSSILGKWYDLSAFALIVMMISSIALITLNNSKRARIGYIVTGILAFLTIYLINHSIAWMGVFIAFLAISIALWRASKHSSGGNKSFFAHISWLPLVIAIISLLLVWQGDNVAKPVIESTNTQYVELSLPWQMTVDVASGAIKNYPWFGIGPNHFAQAFMAYKPLGFNLSNAWSIEFGNGFGFIPTLFVAQGGVGAVLWILFLVFLGIIATRILKRLPDNPESRFVTLSSCGSMIMLWIIALLYVPSHVTMLFALLMTGICIANAVHTGILRPVKIVPRDNKTMKMIFSIVIVALMIVALLWGLIYISKAISLSYFASGIKEINTTQDSIAADKSFRKALSLNPSDIYYQALAENSRIQANQIISIATTSTPEIVTKLSNVINAGIEAARSAIAYDPTNYYNYVSEARVSSVAAQVKMTNAYENTVTAYTNAIRLNPLNPSLYVNLAQVQAGENKLDDALATIGQALQVKNNYLDAVFLLSQIQATQGNLKDAIISANVATQINPQNPLLFFQLGLLAYNDKNYTLAAQALEEAIKLQPVYANAQYFLGLSYVRLNKTTEAVTVFEELKKANPDNKELSFILENLYAGKSPFTDAQPPVTSTPEKRQSLPVKENR